ncbi:MULTISPECIES: PhoH family protein [unclassified Siphonobacter]|uniref:PhoH family protein n=1 Tax=unclassified Siphonobacter TaxID=2635712 RepID=UPI000CC2E949|nr:MULTISPECIES: PhoH family protein [unclassified Siphonobacter]MDQ1089041.1 phosphate starvation-inducible PhoH-like protein [Siphonobacter sp. SORGH_AS_1065]MDR6195216.1 phosphate starvation-inducible PhoH-like protein [Siphonobacter sp. SORGH_AS_0500]PKK38322.1 phosphate starvation-inducible protein PhoH [Siphonobacter sp. SORGH_AS_0500]
MIEKTITLDEVSLVDFLGVENTNIRELSAAFPMSKIISRGNEITIRGTSAEISRITEILESLQQHYLRFGKITSDNVKNYLGHTEEEGSVPQTPTDDDVFLYGNKGIVIRMKTANQLAMVDAVAKHDIVFAVGPAGTGKTYTAVAIAVKALKNKEVRKIIITRPAVEAGENLGFLPGDLKEKIDPYLRPIYDALDDMIPAEKLKLYIENRTIEIAPLAYMRGRTLNNAFILLDEAQNTTTMQLKMFLTRMGPNSKTIITGDRTQVDLPTKMKSGLSEALTILKDVPEIGFVQLDGRDVLRHKLVRLIIEAYEKAEAPHESKR